MAGDRNTVYVADSVREAMDEPSFIIEHEGRFYLTIAVLEYDEKHVENDEQKNGVALVERMFKEAVHDSSVRAVQARYDAARACVNTSSPPQVE